MRIAERDFVALATDGDVHLGGRDWDQRLVDCVAEEFIRKHGVDPRDDPNVEGQLLRALGPVRVVLAAHHGSATSSSRAFVRVMEPSVVLISAGRRNRYGHPHPAVVERYEDVGARVHVTAMHGALEWDSRTPGSVRRWRGDRVRYWVKVPNVD